MLLGVTKLSNLWCSTMCDNMHWTMLKRYVKLITICWETNEVYIAINFCQLFIGKDSSIDSTVTRFINERSQVRVPFTTPYRVFFFLVNDDILITSDFCISFHSLSSFLLNWGRLNVPHTFHANFCSFLISHELKSTDISTPQQPTAWGHHVYSFLSSAVTGVARLSKVNFGQRHREQIISSTLSFKACLCSSTYGCQRIFRNPLLKMEK